MKPETLDLLKKVLCLLENGVKPSRLYEVLREFGITKNHINWQFDYFIQRLDLFWDDDFDEDTLENDWMSFNNLKKKEK
mgnify:FL=1